MASTPSPANQAATPAPPPPDTWQAAAWLDGQPDVAAAVSAALLSGGAPGPADELAFLRGLPCTKQALRDRLEQGGILDRLADCLSKSLTELQEAKAASAEELHDKFVAEDKGFKLKLGGLKDFYGGLEVIIGTPSPQVEQAMVREHCEMQDSTPFDMPNKKATTTSTIEWLFVANPDGGADGQGAPFAPYPKPDRSRKSLPFEHFEAELTRRNDELEKEGHASVGKEEFYAARLYSGPMYLKYNAVLRGLRSPDNVKFAKEMISLCCPMSTADAFAAGTISFDEAVKSLNKYPTTLHAISSSIIKLSKLTKAKKVYRGVSGGVLPDDCRTPNSYGVRGGVEGGFMSTTTDKATAFFYASGGADKSKQGGPAIVFETQMGMVDRGADVGWLSQFPNEEEILFAPLTGVEVRGSRVEGAVQVYEVTLTVNMASLTIEQVLNKRHRLLKDMSQNIVLEVPSALAGTGLEQKAKSKQDALTKELERSILDQLPERFNDDSRFLHAVQTILDMKSSEFGTVRILKDMQELEPSELMKHAAFAVAQLSNRSADVRDAAVETFGVLNKPDLALWAPKLIKLADACEEAPATMSTAASQCAVLDVLGALAPEDLLTYADAIFARMAESACPDLVRSHCAKALSKLQDQDRLDRSASLAYPLAHSQDASEEGSRIRSNARELLCRAPSVLLHAFQEDDAEERFRALHALHVLNLSGRGISHTPWLNGAAELLTDDDKDVRGKATEVFKHVVKTEPSAAEAYVEMTLNSLEDSTEKVRRKGAEFLRNLAPRQFAQYFDTIRSSLSSPTDLVRYEAVQAIRLGLEHDPGLKTSDVEAELRRMLEDQDSTLVERAKKAVEFIESMS